MKTSNKITAILFCLLIFGSFALNIFLPDKLYSEEEKRELAQTPEFTVNRVLSGEFMTEFDKYASDQFYGRNTWVYAKNMSQYLLGHRMLNDVYVTENRYMRKLNIDVERLNNNLNAILKMAEKSDIPITLMVVPEASTVYEDQLPYGEKSREGEVMDKVYEILGDKVNIVYPKETLKAHADEYIYFKGDHHWTMKGALYAYNEMMGTDKNHKFKTVAYDFKGTMVSKAGVKLPWISLDQIEVPEEITNDNFYVLVDRDGSGFKDSFMFMNEFLNEFDKYRFFQGGDQPIMAIGSTGEGRSLVIKDSFANVMLPYLAMDRKDTYVMDMRYNRMSPVLYAKSMGLDEIILIYSPDSLCNEFSLVNLGN